MTALASDVSKVQQYQFFDKSKWIKFVSCMYFRKLVSNLKF